MNHSKLSTHKHSRLLLPVLIVLALLFPIVFQSYNYILSICCYILIYIIAVSGLDIIYGYCGQISLGHAAFFATGAYISAMLHNYAGIPVLLSMVFAAAISAAIGALIAYPASKLVFHFLSLATQAVGEIVYIIISHSPGNVTGNYTGIFTSHMSLFGFKFNNYFRFFYFALACASIFLLAKHLIVNSRTGRAFLAIRENTHAADGMGINVRRYKVQAFAISTFFTGFAGAMFVHMGGFAHPDSFLYAQSVRFLTMLLFGGTGSLLGPVFGATSVMLVTEALRNLQDYMTFIYGILMLLIIVAMPGGIYGEGKRFIAYAVAKLKNRKNSLGGASNA